MYNGGNGRANVRPTNSNQHTRCIMELTQAYLKSILNYDPETGVFVNRVDRAYNAKAGIEAGWATTGGYKSIVIKGKKHKLHRLAWLYTYGEWPKYIDHINGDASDNRISNLRSIEKIENHKNMRRFSSNTSGVTGVNLDRSSNKWVAKIMVNYRAKSLGYYSDWFEAVCARKSAERLYGFHVNHGRTPKVN